MLVRTKDSLYQVIQAGHWQAMAPVQTQEMENPVNRWTGPKRTLAHWRQVQSFFEWTQDTYKDEAMMHWFVNAEQGRWEPMPLPQRGQGMTVKILEDHAQYVPTFERLGAGWEMMGTDHHHCTGGAFQSGTDHSDEKTKEGLHITLGNLGSPKYSIHFRSSFRGLIMPTLLSDWFELPAEYEGLPINIKEAIMSHLLTTPVKVEFPEWWKENVIRWGSYSTPSTYSYGGGISHYPSSYQSPGNGKSKHTLYNSTWRDELAHELEMLCGEKGLTPVEMLEWAIKLKDANPLEEVFKIASWSAADLNDVIDAIKEIVEDEEKEDEAQEDARTTFITGYNTLRDLYD